MNCPNHNGLQEITQNLWLILAGRKFRRLCLYLLLLCVSIALVATITALSIFDRQHNNILHDYVAKDDDIAILSTTYYNRSKSFENNTVVILFNAHQVLHYKHAELTATSSNESVTVKTKFRVFPVIQQLPFFCKWVPFIAVGQVSENIKLLELSTGGQRLPLRLRTPYRKPRGVVACFSPLFLSERWQLLLLTVEVYSYYGAFMHFYVRSMISDLFLVIKHYKNTRVVPWGSVQLGEERANSKQFDPNLELEFRNQAAAMTDCLLMYKESAEFIIFPDSDDIIIPRIGRDYYEEFRRVFDMFPDAAAIAYNMSQTSITAATSPEDYSVSSVLSSIRFKGEIRWGKLVAKPERLDSMWIHHSYGIREGYEQVALPVELNCILHLRFWNFTDSPTNTSSLHSPLYNPTLSIQSDNEENLLVENDDLQRIHYNFLQTTRILAETYERLPQYTLYYPLIERCYDRIFYNGKHHNTCKGPEMCDLPNFPGIRCTNVKSSFSTFTGYTNLFIHYQDKPRFVHSKNGCTM